MNTGLQDAYNLAWKLALVIKQKANHSLLDSYQLERFPVISKIVEKTDQLTHMVLFDKTFFTKLRKFGKSVQQLKTAKKISMQLTELDIRYENSPIIDYQKSLSAKSPKQGDRAPDVKFGKSDHLYSRLRNILHNILIFSGISATKDDLNAMQLLHDSLKKTFSETVKSHIISINNITNLDNVIIDSNADIHSRYNIKKPSIYVIRPDNYISYFSEKVDINLLEKFLKTYLIK